MSVSESGCVYSNEGGFHEKGTLEGIRILDCTERSGGVNCRIFDTQRCGNLRINGSETAFITAGLGIPGGLDNPVCTNGHQCRQGLAGRGFTGETPICELVYYTARCKLLLATVLFQPASLWLRSCMVDFAVGTGVFADPE